MRALRGLICLAIAVPLFAQTSAKVDVRVVNVDVSVIDANGKSVTGLRAEDFEVREDNQPEKVTNFTTVDRPSPGQTGGHRAGDMQLRRRVILLVDNNYIVKSDRDAALRKLDEFIDSTFDGSYEWALGMIGQQLEILQPFTPDKKAIHAAIAKIRASATTSYSDNMDRSMLDDSLYQRRDGLDVPAGFESRERTTRNSRSMQNTARGLIDATHIFATTEGKKLAVLLTGSMDLNTGFGSFSSDSDRELQDAKTATAKMIAAIVSEANAANMSIHVIRVAAHQSAAPQHDVSYHSSGRGVEGMDVSSDSDIRDTSPGFTIAQGTGGLYLTSNSVSDSYKAINSAIGISYLLGYEPGHGEDRQFHHITVRVKRPGTRIIYRQGYLDLPEDERLERLLRLRISALQPASDVPVTLNVSGLKAEGKPAVAMLAAMPMAKVTLLPKDGRYVGRVHVYLSIFDANGNNVGFHHQIRDLSLTAAEHDKAVSNAFQYQMNVRLDKGDFTVAITMRDDLSNEIGTAVKKLKL
ncbi:MAG TPA: VWA domain-containing protein [Thermoanaerobaculia bacterium]|jgi:VWFA-related protein|nr:VWA domain-containing protein [Thermoanaerobaculia bacterium]